MDVRNLTVDVRNRLRSMNYDEDFSIDSVNLVNHLLTDLQNKNQSFDQLQERDNRLAADLTLAQAQLFPLRRENAKLARENNELHKDQIKQTDDSRAFCEDLSRKIRFVEDELVESKLKYQAKTVEFTALVQNLDRIREAYGTLMDQKVASASRGMKLSSKISSFNGFAHSAVKLRLDPLVKKDVEVVDSLRHQVESLSAALHTADDENKRLQTAILAREQELTRSSRMLTVLSAGQVDSENAVAPSNRTEQLLAADVANKRVIDQLNGQVDFLNEQLARAQEELRQGDAKIRRFDSVKGELVQRTSLLEETRRNYSQSTSHVRALEQKILDLEQQIVLLEQTNVTTNPQHQQNNSLSELEIKTGEEDVVRRAQEQVIATLTVEKEQLQDEVDRLHRVTSVLEGSKNVKTSTKGKIVVGRSTTGQSLNSLQQTSRSDALVVSLNKEVETLRLRVTTVTKALTQSEEHCRLAVAEKDALSQRLKMHDSARDRSDVLRANQDLQERLSRVEALRDDLILERDQLKGLLDQARRDTVEARRSLGDVELARQQLESRCSTLAGELTACQGLLSSSKDNLFQSQERCIQLEVQIEEVRLVADLAGRKNEHLQRDLAAAMDTVRERSTQVAEATRSLSQHQLQSAASSTADQLLVDNHRLQVRVGELEEEVRRWEADFDPVIQYLAVDQGVRRSHSSTLRDERKQILEILQARERSLSFLESETERLRHELLRRESIQANQETTVASLRQEFLNCQAMCQRQAAQVAQMEADRDLLKQRSSVTRVEVDQAHLQVESLQKTLTQTVDFLSIARRDVSVLTGQVQQAKEKQEAAEQSLALHRQQSDQLQRRQLSGHQDMQSVLLEKAELENRLEEYKLLLSNTDAGSRAHSQQMEAMLTRLRNGEQSEQRLEREVATLKTVLIDRDTSILTLQRNLEVLDIERDRLQELLDCADERDSQTGVMTRQLESGCAQLQQLIHQLEKKLSVSTKELVCAHRQNAVTEARLNSVQNELTSLGRRFQESQSEVDSAAKDLQLMTRENQALTSELALVSAEKERLKARVGELMQSLAGTQQSLRALEIEKNDLLETYRGVIQDKRRVEGDLGVMSALKNKEGMNGQQLADQLSECHSIINAFKNGERKWMGEKVSLIKQLEVLNDQLVRAADRLQQAETDRRQIVQDTVSLRQTNAMLNERITLILTRATSAIESNKMLTAQLGKTERECNAVRSLLQLEKQRTEEQAQITAALRAQAARESTNGSPPIQHNNFSSSKVALSLQQQHIDSEMALDSDVVMTSVTTTTTQQQHRVHSSTTTSSVMQSEVSQQADQSPQ